MLRATLIALALTIAVGPAASAQTAAAVVPPVRIRYIVNDVQTAASFYRDALGFKIDFQSGPFFAAVSRGGVQLLLSATKGPGGASQPMPDGQKPVPAGGWNRLVIYTADLKADADRLRRAGVHFHNDIVIGVGGNEVLVDDPSGNIVELFQPTGAYALGKTG